jgi:hypothetical protein
MGNWSGKGKFYWVIGLEKVIKQDSCLRICMWISQQRLTHKNCDSIGICKPTQRDSVQTGAGSINYDF